MAADVIVVRPAHERPALRLPRLSVSRGGGASAAADEPQPTSKAVELLLSIGSVVGAVILGLTLFASSSGFRPMVVRSGSMEPTIQTGSMVLMREVPASDIQVGDVVSVQRADRTRVTHRVLEVKRSGSAAVLTLKGDANEDPDPAPVTVQSAYRMVFTIPSIGRVSAWLATPAGGFGLGCMVTAVVLAVVRRRAPGSGAAVPAAPLGVRRVTI